MTKQLTEERIYFRFMMKRVRLSNSSVELTTNPKTESRKGSTKYHEYFVIYFLKKGQNY